MAKNVILKPRVQADINERIARVHRGLGNPEPPLKLETVRELLKLDFSYYTADDPGMMRETISRIKVGAQRLLNEPTLFLEAVRKLDLRALYIPDGRQILLDKDQPPLKHRWTEAHEIGHSVIPWHEASMMGDIDYTLAPACHDKLEAEANYAAGRLLFLGDRFIEECASVAPGFDTLKQLKDRFGNTFSTTLWRSIMVWGRETPVVGLITGHPHPDRWADDFDRAAPCKHLIQSPAFARRFSRIKETTIFDDIVAYCSAKKGGPLGGDAVVLSDDNGDSHVFAFESFSFHHQTLTLGVYESVTSSPVRS